MHRDLKPANLLLTSEGVLKVADMGLARMRDAEAERAGGYTHTVATRWYRAPELLLASHSYGPAADMWSVGCILAEMLGMSCLGSPAALTAPHPELSWYHILQVCMCEVLISRHVFPYRSGAVLCW